MNRSVVDSYSKYYSNQLLTKLWPTEFAVRALLGRNYGFENNGNYDTALDLGFGDGRNIGLLNSICKHTHGLEIDEKICESARKNFPDSEFFVGFSNSIHKPDNTYDLVLAVHSIYYCSDYSIDAHFNEVLRVLKNNGRLVFSIPTHDSYLVHGSKQIDNEYVIVKKDPLGIRDESLIKFFSSSDKLLNYLKIFGYKNIKIGLSDNNWWGIRESYWIVSCYK